MAEAAEAAEAAAAVRIQVCRPPSLHDTYGVTHSFVYTDTPLCKIHRVYVWRVSQGGVYGTGDTERACRAPSRATATATATASAVSERAFSLACRSVGYTLCMLYTSIWRVY